LTANYRIFTTRPGSRDLWSSTGKRIEEFFDQSGLAVVRDRVQRLSEEDLEKQIWFIRASIATLSDDVDWVRQPVYRTTETQPAADRERLLAAAQAVGDRLDTLALRGESDATWIGLTLTGKGQ
jgi:lantibiotic modifying enzyme